jgi:hypothetical protein
MYTYLYKSYFRINLNLGDLGFVNSAGFNAYYITSTIAYLSLLMMYLPRDIKNFFSNKLPVLYLPLWYLNFVNFHIASILILLYVVVKNVANFYKKRNFDNFLVMFAFISIVIFHACLLLASFDSTIYLAANSLLAIGFASLLLMLIRVSRSDRKKI